MKTDYINFAIYSNEIFTGCATLNVELVQQKIFSVTEILHKKWLP